MTCMDSYVGRKEKQHSVKTIPVCKAVKNNAEKYNTNIHLGILFCLHTYNFKMFEHLQNQY